MRSSVDLLIKTPVRFSPRLVRMVPGGEVRKHGKTRKELKERRRRSRR